ncbi:uncharacterized protein LOC131801522 [Musca domestica]|uniref:Uncharacterized protein LOC131801522 n=2 Tax=Musca domestica TaxID=7370 RepID=A0ABM3URU9_MUSDO|nr:uncharacterized protein LOC131801522 [Musca domestica]
MYFKNFFVNIFILFGLVIAWSTVANGAFPDDPKPCKYGDEQCIGKVIGLIAREKYGGDDSLNLSAMDPIPVKKFHIKQGSDSPVNIDLLFTNNVGIGLKTATLLKTKGFGKDLATKHEVIFKTDKLALVGDYKISGKVLVLPIHGSGKSNVTLVEPKITISWMGTPNVKDGGATHMKLDKFTVDLEPKNVIFNFENLFNDKFLSDNMNKFLTDSWKETYPEIHTALTKGLAPIARNVIQGVFDKHPYEKLFLESSRSKMPIKVVILLVAVAIGGVIGDFPDDPKPCKHGDVECIGKLFNYFMIEKHSGDTNYDLKSIDPLFLETLVVARGAESPVNIRCSMNGSEVLGIKTLRFEKKKGFGKEIAGKHEISGQAQYLSLVGDYVITGSVLILPIKGEGKANITMHEPKYRIGWTGSPYEKDGATYMRVKNFYIDLYPKSITFNFENLYNNKELSDNMNKFLTKNWSEIYPELAEPLTRGVSFVANQVVDRFFAKYPYEKYFTN